MDCIQLDGMEFYGFHGCLPSERQTGQTFFVDAKLYLELQQAGRSDELSATVNYADVFTDIRDIVEGEPVNLIETVAERIAAVILKNYDLVSMIEVTVHKPSAPIPGKFRDAAVSLTRKRL